MHCILAANSEAYILIHYMFVSYVTFVARTSVCRSGAGYMDSVDKEYSLSTVMPVLVT